MKGRPYRASRWLALVAALAMGVLMALPRESLDQAPMICLYRAATGRLCFGCGMTHAFWSLLHGRVAEAAHFNRGVFLFFPACCGLVLYEVVRSARRLPALAIPKTQFSLNCPELVQYRPFSGIGLITGIIAANKATQQKGAGIAGTCDAGSRSSSA
jgi:hypothetical protein